MAGQKYHYPCNFSWQADCTNKSVLTCAYRSLSLDHGGTNPVAHNYSNVPGILLLNFQGAIGGKHSERKKVSISLVII